MGLDHGVGHPVLFGLTYSTTRRTERRRRYLNGGQYSGKHGAGLLPEKPFRRCRPVRALDQEVMHRRQACSLPGVGKTSQFMVTQREVPIASFDIGAGALEHLRERCSLVLEPVLLTGRQRTQRPTGLKKRCPEALGQFTQRLAVANLPGGSDTLNIVQLIMNQMRMYGVGLRLPQVQLVHLLTDIRRDKPMIARILGTTRAAFSMRSRHA